MKRFAASLAVLQNKLGRLSASESMARTLGRLVALLTTLPWKNLQGSNILAYFAPPFGRKIFNNIDTWWHHETRKKVNISSIFVKTIERL
jgi:hypothetical protein